MTTEWAETKAILSEVEQLFNRDDDIRYIFDVKKMAKEIDSHCSSYLLETKEIIKSKRRERGRHDVRVAVVLPHPGASSSSCCCGGVDCCWCSSMRPTARLRIRRTDRRSRRLT